MFKDSDGNSNFQLARSLFRLMEVQFYLIGDSIIKVGDKNSEFFLVLEGQADVINIKGRQIIGTLFPGDHFGENSVLFDLSLRIITVISSKISQIGVVSKENLEKMFLAYPE